MKNIMFSTTRQWNIGDEFILFGVRNILENLLKTGGVNSIIYNRNPSINPIFHRSLSGVIKRYVHNLIPECDNSYHERIDAKFIDVAICAGTPEWRGKRMVKFYKTVNTFDIPFIALGVGEIGQFHYADEEEVIKRASVLTFRSKRLANEAQKFGLTKALYLPCPALLSVKANEEKNWRYNKSEIVVGFGFNIPREYTVSHIGISRETYDFSEKLFEEIIRTYRNSCRFVCICHYIDELPHAIKFFKKFGIDVVYSYDARDYGGIYSNIDVLVSSRVHGCGIAASLGIPSLGISHDERGETIAGFLAEIVTPKDDIKLCLMKIANILESLDQKHVALIEHKRSTLKIYSELLIEKAPFLCN